MTTVAERVITLAASLDDTGRPTSPISVRATRETLRRSFKPEKRGGPLMCGAHEVIPVQFANPEPEQLDIEGECNADHHEDGDNLG
jgi:hypothetical protein